MKDYRDDHSPDIALLLTVAEIMRELTVTWGRPDLVGKMDAALKLFEHHPDPIQQQLQDETQLDHDAAKDGREWSAT